MDVVRHLQDWYQSQCDEDWEHSNGVEIDTLDNPGWRLKVDLIGTHLEDEPFEEITSQVSDTDWYQCRIEDGKFVGYGDPRKLQVLLQTFVNWAKSHDGWLQPPVYETVSDENARFWNLLDGDVADEPCRISGCESNRIRDSVLCRRHHFEKYKQIE